MLDLTGGMVISCCDKPQSTRLKRADPHGHAPFSGVGNASIFLADCQRLQNENGDDTSSQRIIASNSLRGQIFGTIQVRETESLMFGMMQLAIDSSIVIDVLESLAMQVGISSKINPVTANAPSSNTHGPTSIG